MYMEKTQIEKEQLGADGKFRSEEDLEWYMYRRNMMAKYLVQVYSVLKGTSKLIKGGEHAGNKNFTVNSKSEEDSSIYDCFKMLHLYY